MEAELQSAILSYLAATIGADGKPEVLEAINTLRKEFGVEEDKSLPYLPDVFAAGITKAKADKKADDDIEASPKFQKFLASVQEKGYFKGAEVGTAEYRKRFNTVLSKYRARLETAGGQSSDAKADDFDAAERHKAQGNEALSAKNIDKAIECYTNAIAASPSGQNTHIYYSNRAAAYTMKEEYSQAVEDARKAVAIEPGFAKAYVRLGTALFYQKLYSDAVTAYEKAVELDPSNEQARKYLSNAKEQAEKSTSPQPQGPGGFGGGMGGMGGLGDMGGLSGLFNNPMVQNMMNNPEIMKMATDMMQNPEVMSQMSSMFSGGGGGLGNLASMFGGGGGGAAAAGGAEGSGEAEAGASAGDPARADALMQKLETDPALAELKDDPEVLEFIEDIRNNGMASLSRHMGKPKVMQLASKMMGSMGQQ